MGKPVAGEVVVIPFPFSDLTGSKRRPALVLAALDGDDVILCMITSQAKSDRYAVPLEAEDFDKGGLSVPSNIRPSRLFTASSQIVASIAGKVSESKFAETIKVINDIISA